MKVLAPISRVSEVLPFLEAGANEFYCGVMSREWEEKYTDLFTLNRRGGSSANFDSYEDLSRALELSHSAGAPVFCVLNVQYTADQYPLVAAIVRDLEDLGVDGLILSDIGVMRLVKELGTRMEIHVSTLANSFNRWAVEFFARLGAARLVLPRDLMVSEIRRIVTGDLAIQYEAIVLNDPCRFVDGFCTYYHNVPLRAEVVEDDGDLRLQLASYDPQYEGPGCKLAYARTDRDPWTGEILDARARPPGGKSAPCASPKACGLCAFFDLAEAGVGSVKIAGRGRESESMRRDVELVRGALRILEESGPDRAAFLERVRSHALASSEGIDCEANCYYPSVRGS